MRISDWSSDVCSSDLLRLQPRQALGLGLADLPPAVLRPLPGLCHLVERELRPRLAVERGKLRAEKGSRKTQRGRGVEHLVFAQVGALRDRKSTRLNSSH